MDESLAYLEVGTHCGSTLIGASLELPNKKFWGVDNFAGHNSPEDIGLFDSIEHRLQDAIERLGHSNVKYIKSDYLEFCKNTNDLDGMKVGVYLYDGNHEEKDQYFGLKNVTHLLNDECIVFVDDSGFNDRQNVWGALNKLLSEDKRVKFLREWTPVYTHGDKWQGFVALTFRR